MKLLRLKLENWRAIEQAETQFHDGVTIVQGPNEIGKSSLIEALCALLDDFDSTNRQGIKAVKPVNRDAGPFVEAEVRSGQYHFVYAKRFLKNKQTELTVLEPETENLTGREAHVRVLGILDETMDRALWRALLVEQGSALAQAGIRESAGLARALDNVTGASGTGDENPAFIAAIKSEYEKYFTPTGLSRTGPQEQALEKAAQELDDARKALAEVEQDQQAHENALAEVRSLRESRPGLEQLAHELDAEVERLRKLEQTAATRRSERDGVSSKLEVVQERLGSRERQALELKEMRQSIVAVGTRIESLEARREELARKLESARAAEADAGEELKKARRAQRLAEGDRDYWLERQQMSELSKRQARLEQLDRERREQQDVLDRHPIDDATLDKIERADREVDAARARKSEAATRLVVDALADLSLVIDGESTKLQVGESAERELATATDVEVPGLVRFAVQPPVTAEELEDRLQQATEERARLLKRSGVESYAAAQVAARAAREARATLETLADREDDLLDGLTRDELSSRLAELQRACQAWEDERPGEPALPESAEEARSRAQEWKSTVERLAERHEAEAERVTAARDELQDVETDLAAQKAELQAKQNTAAQSEARLEKDRSGQPDDDLRTRRDELSGEIERLDGELREAERQLEEAGLESLQARLANATEALDRNDRELREAERTLGVCEDRLERARADGRFETLEAAEREHARSKRECAQARRWAAAVDLLKSTVERCRDDARKAYAAPLREQIERLGKVVFGSDFSIRLGDDWTIEARTLAGKTIPFDDLSVGAREQLGIITRLAVARIVAEEGGVPLIVDDVLGFSDPSRLETMGAALAEAGRDSQVIVLTCMPDRFRHVGNAQVVKLAQPAAGGP